MVEVYISSSMCMCKGTCSTNIKTGKSAQEIMKDKKSKSESKKSSGNKKK